MDGSPSPFEAQTLQALHRNLESWCVDLFIPDSPVVLLTFNQDMDLSKKPLRNQFEGTDSTGAPISIAQVAWESSTVLRVHTNIAFESTLEYLGFLGPTIRLRTATGIYEKAFELHSFDVCP